MELESLSPYEISELIEKEMENFMHENPYGDSRDLAIHFFHFGMKYIEKKLTKTLEVM